MKTIEGTLFDAALGAARTRIALQSALGMLLPIVNVSASEARRVKAAWCQAAEVGETICSVFARSNCGNILPFPRLRA